MGLSQCLFLFFLFLFKGCNTTSHGQPFNCHDEESSALLQFKQSFIIDADASVSDGAYPKVWSWKPAVGGNITCCSTWNGVECDENTGQVIGLDLSSSCLFGSINSSSPLFRLVHLQRLNLADNHFNYSKIPITIRNFSSLMYLNLSHSVFFGQVPLEVSQLSKLSSLDLSVNMLNGSFSASLANLTQLKYLSLENNNFNGGPLSWAGKLTKLTKLYLEGINLSGYIPSSLGKLTQLTRLHLPYNQLTGPIPSWLGNLSQLVYLDLGYNKLNGSIPESLFNLRDLKVLALDSNGLTGVVDIFKVQNVPFLQLGGNKLEVITESRTMNATVLPMFTTLGLASCDIKEFPSFLRYQQKLHWLDLRVNKLHGKVPKWMWNTSTQTLQFLDLSYNFLTGFDQPSPVFFPWVNLKVLRLYSNMLYGQVPIPPSNIRYYASDDNKLVGEIPRLICNLSTLQYLDLSNNKLSGMLPQCLGNFSDDLRVLDLRNNSFRGILPHIYTNNLRMIDVSDNKLQGKLPRSLADCVMLESLVLSNNEFNDDFPIWLGMLPELKLLAMNHNGFHGVIENTKKNLHFPELRILDISYNNFRGEFPSEYIFSGNAMRGIAQSQPTYMDTRSDINISASATLFSFAYSITITNKGVERYYEQIREDLGVVDISNNNFEGNIPEFIGNLNGLRFLNISHNSFTGSIPSGLGNLTLLEALDLSQNHLSGDIPQQLAQLTTLAYFNVSYNHLTGSVPQGPQFQTFESTSFEGNTGLCGEQLPKKCGNSMTPAPLPPSSTEEDDSGSRNEFHWKFLLAGFGSGLVVGVVLADMAITRKRELFLEIVRMLIKLIKRIRSKRLMMCL